MQLAPVDWVIIFGLFAVTLGVGVYSARGAGSSSTEFFLSGRNMPWWLLGISMVATTFSSDTPNLVTDIVRKNGVAGNWVWWAFLLTGMLTVFIYARLWRRSGVLTDIEFYELRYSGKSAAFLRGFRALYLGFFFNVVIVGRSLVSSDLTGPVADDVDFFPGSGLGFDRCPFSGAGPRGPNSGGTCSGSSFAFRRSKFVGSRSYFEDFEVRRSGCGCAAIGLGHSDCGRRTLVKACFQAQRRKG